MHWWAGQVSIPLCNLAWEGDAVRPASPDTGQNRWNEAARHGNSAGAVLFRLIAPAGKPARFAIFRVYLMSFISVYTTRAEPCASLFAITAPPKKFSGALIGLVITAVATVMAAPPAQAQAVATAVLAPVVVTAARVPQAQTDALPYTTVITAEDIRASQAVDLPSLLRREAGIQFTQNGGIGQASGLFVRGAETRQTLVLIDGVPLTKQDATGTVSIEHLMLDQIDHVEIVRGNVSSIYGSGAIGGVIQIFTRRGDGAPHSFVEAEVGSRRSFRFGAGVSGSSGDAADALRYAVSVSRFGTAGFSSLNPTQVPDANPDRDGYQNNSLAASLSKNFGREQQVGGRVALTQGRFAFDSSFGTPTDVHTGKTNVDALSLYTHNRISERWDSRLTYSDAVDRNANHYDTSFGITDDRFRSHTRMLQWTNEIILTHHWSATAGVERQWQGLTSDDGYGDVFRVNRNANSVFAGAQGSLGDHQLQFNLRRDSIDNLDGATTGYLGYGYLLSQNWKALASVATGFAAPPLGYLYAPFYGNPSLKPERSRSAEIGVQYAAGDTLLRAALFDSRTRELLQYDPVASTFNNVSRARNHGLEVSASGTLAATSLRASLTLQEPRDESSGERLRRRAQTLASLAATRSYGAWQVGGDVGFTGSRPDGAAALAGYALLNVNTRYQISNGVELYARVDNLTDRRYQTATGYNQAPRGVFAGVRWQP